VPDLDLRRQREALVHRHIAAEMAGDAAGTVATFAVPRYDLVSTETVLDTAEAVAARVDALFETMPGAVLEIASLRHADDAIIVETRTTGRHDGPLMGVAPTGRPYTIRGCAIFRFEGADLVEEIVYNDRLTLIEQLASPVQK